VLGATTSLPESAARTREVASDAVSNPFVAAVGLLTLASASLGALVLYRVRRGYLP
jgi:hypothetical protein